MAMKFNYAIICEDVRREDNGKLIILGVYGRNIRVQEFPATLALGLVMSVTTDETGKFDFEFQCLINGERKAGARGQMIVNDSGGMTLINIPAMPIIDIKGETEIVFQAREVKADWQTVASIPLNGPPSPKN